jgi:hypothetical protein
MSNYSIPFVMTNINSTSSTSLPYVTNPVRIRPIPITSSNTITSPVTLVFQYSTPGQYSTWNHIYTANFTGNVTFTNFNINTSSFPIVPRIFTIDTTTFPTGYSITYSNLTNSGFSYNIRANVTYSGFLSTPSSRERINDISFSYFAST